MRSAKSFIFQDSNSSRLFWMLHAADNFQDTSRYWSDG